MLETLITLLTVSLLAQMSPGPDMMLIIKHSATGSRKQALSCALGSTMGLSFHITLSLLGVAVIISQNHFLFKTIQYLGAIYLIYIGLKSFKNNESIDLNLKAENIDISTLSSFKEGLVCNLLNPKVTIFILSIFTQMISPATTTSNKLVFGGAMILEAIVVWFLFILILKTKIVQNIFKNHISLINKIAGIALCVLGGGIFVIG